MDGFAIKIRVDFHYRNLMWYPFEMYSQMGYNTSIVISQTLLSLFGGTGSNHPSKLLQWLYLFQKSIAVHVADGNTVLSYSDPAFLYDVDLVQCHDV